MDLAGVWQKRERPWEFNSNEQFSKFIFLSTTVNARTSARGPYLIFLGKRGGGNSKGGVNLKGSANSSIYVNQVTLNLVVNKRETFLIEESTNTTFKLDSVIVIPKSI